MITSRLLISLALSAALGALAPSAASAEPSNPGDEARLATSVDRELLVRLAVQRSPALSAARARAAAMRSMGAAESRLPAPEAELQVWQIPASRPYAVGDAQMIMLGLRQPIPAPGSLSARAEAKERAANVEETMVAERVREIAGEVSHALSDYTEAAEKQRAHLAHRSVAERVLAAARARYASGGALDDVAQAEVEVARIEVDVEQQSALIAVARARLNGLLLRASEAPLGLPAAGDAVTTVESDADLMVRAETHRPEVRSIRARTAVREAEARVSDAEASWPMLSIGATWFAPTNQMPHNAYGVSVGASLPWLWGRSKAEARASRAGADATREELREIVARIRAEVAADAASVRAAVRRYQVLRDRALPAGKRSWEAAAAGYESSRTNILSLLAARKALVELELDLVEARAAIDHALVNLDQAVGAPVRRAPIPSQP